MDREHYVPLRVADLVNFLVAGAGAKVDPSPLAPDDQAAFRRIADWLVDHYHRTFLTRFRRIKDSFAPFDPDRDTVSVVELSREDKDRSMMALFHELRDVLEKGNYIELTRPEAEKIMRDVSPWGVDLEVDWSVFEHIELHYRGDTMGPRSIRKWWMPWKREVRMLPEFNRLVVLLKLRPHKRLGAEMDTKSVFMKVFKDMPKADLEMVLPGTRIRLSKWDKGMIVYPVMSGVALLIYKLLSEWLGFGDFLSIAASVSLSWSLAGLFAGYGYKSYASYTTKKTKYTLQLAQSLYYQVIDSNGGVLFRLIDEAEEQEVREALLAYYYLWRDARAMTADELDNRVEEDLDRRLGVKVDFEIADALGKLSNLNLVRTEGNGYRAVSLQEATAACGFA
jgi:Protein of unknown function (DUF3754)